MFMQFDSAPFEMEPNQLLTNIFLEPSQKLLYREIASITNVPVPDLLLVNWLYSLIIFAKFPSFKPIQVWLVDAVYNSGFHALKITSCPIYSDSKILQISSHGSIGDIISDFKLSK